MPPSDQGAEHLDAQMPGAFPDVDESQAQISTTHQTLQEALFERRAEYSRPRNVRIKVGTWNVAGLKGTEKDIGAWFVQGKGIEESLAGLGVRDDSSEHTRESVASQEARSTTAAPTVPRDDQVALLAGEDVGIYALGLQEVVDITSATEALRPYTDPTAANRWKAEIEKVLPAGYKLVAEQQLIGLLLLVYASPDVIPHVKSVSTTSVGTGLMGYMGNKGAVTARIVLGETTRLVFINSHLAAGADKVALERRNWDAGQITSRTRFAPITDAMDLSQGSGERLGEEDFAFWFGDLNYRLEGIPGEDVRRLLTIHTRGQGPEPAAEDAPRTSSTASEVSDMKTSPISPSAATAFSTKDAVPLPPELDPASLHTTLSCLLPHDELHQQQRLGKAFHDGWKEGPIRFLPSYKYDVGKVGVFDSSEKKRGPSWCDRILYRTRASKLRYEVKAKEQEEARKRDEEMKAKGLENSEEVLYDYDPDTDGGANAEYDEYDEDAVPEPEAVITKEGYLDEIQLEHYTTHLRVLSSDHKPLDAIFNLKFDAVIPELKAAIHQEVARELDRLENEGRPSIAVVVDRSSRRASEVNKNTTDGAFDGVDFNDIQYAKSKRRNLTIANTGRVPATFWFADRPAGPSESQGPFPKWLSVHFDREPDAMSKTSPDNHETYTLQPAEVCNAELRLKIDTMEAVRKLNEETTMLDEILVIRVADGRDHFLPVRGRWLQSSLARSIDKLVKIPEGGIRKLQHQKPDWNPDTEKVRWSVPREIFRLTEAVEDLTVRAVAEWDMTSGSQKENMGTGKAPWQNNAGWPFIKDARYFSDSAHEDTLAAVFNALDCNEPFDTAFSADVSSMQKLEILAEALLQFLDSLQDGVVTAPLWEKLEQGIVARERAKQHLDTDDEKMFVLETLSSSPTHNATFLLLMSMLEHVAREVSNGAKPDPKTPRASIDLPGSPQVSVRRRTLSKVPEVAIRQLIDRNYATVFADKIFRAEMGGLKEKDKAAKKERMIRVVELFIWEGK